ncbi:MAG: cell wall biosynthesis glycosyltransferase [Parcubacteria group bacterium Gr01-1014_38]|nr:MAG: cell wall biosynthesis glycosyltransferase [Parcubacteria group bacterium Gr01-1014_38]
MTLTVVIPAWNSAASIVRVLCALRPQLLPHDAVVVVDDGSTDATPELIPQEQLLFGGRLHFTRQEHRGAAAARNHGMAVSTTDLVLFLGADMLPAASLLARHRAVHQQYPEETTGCLGFVTWDPLLPPTPFMVWLEHGGSQNAYGEIAGLRWVDLARYCYGSNISFKRTFVQRARGFDEQNFRTYGWEDLDLGIRLAARGGRIYYEPSARAYHAHHYSFDSWVRRQTLAGESFVTIARIHPTRESLPRTAVGMRYAARRFLHHFPLGASLRSLARHSERRWILPGLYARVSGWVFTKSVHQRLAR